jgi:hypothetical protein
MSIEEESVTKYGQRTGATAANVEKARQICVKSRSGMAEDLASQGAGQTTSNVQKAQAIVSKAIASTQTKKSS